MELDPKATAAQADTYWESFAKLIAAHPKTTVFVAVAAIVLTAVIF